MPLELSVQFNILIYSLLAGLFTGILFDAYRIIRGININKIVVIIEDILFWILTALIIFAFLLYTNYAFLGAYVYIFIFLALTLYLKILSNYVITFEVLVLKNIYKFIRIIFKNLSYPLKIISKSIGNKNK